MIKLKIVSMFTIVISLMLLSARLEATTERRSVSNKEFEKMLAETPLKYRTQLLEARREQQKLEAAQRMATALERIAEIKNEQIEPDELFLPQNKDLFAYYKTTDAFLNGLLLWIGMLPCWGIAIITVLLSELSSKLGLLSNIACGIFVWQLLGLPYGRFSLGLESHPLLLE